MVEVADDVHEHEGECLRCGGEFEWAGVERLHADATGELLDGDASALVAHPDIARLRRGLSCLLQQLKPARVTLSICTTMENTSARRVQIPRMTTNRPCASVAIRSMRRGKAAELSSCGPTS